MSKTSDEKADAAMMTLWHAWFSYDRSYRGANIPLSAADQKGFYIVASPILRKLAASEER